MDDIKDKKEPQATPPQENQKQLAEAEAARDDLKAQLAIAKTEAAEAQKALAETAAAKVKAEDDLTQLTQDIAAGKAVVKVPGTYKGYSFLDGYTRVRDKQGAICSSAKVMAAAANKNDPGHEDAVDILDWLIDIGYAYLVKVKK